MIEKDIHHAKTKQQKPEVTILISDKAELRTRKFIRNKWRYYVIKNGSVLQEDKTILKVYVPNKSVKIYEVKTDKTERRNRQSNYYSWILQQISFQSYQTKQAENQLRI